MTSCNRFLNELCYSRKKSMRRLGKLRFAILLLFCTSPIFGQTRDNSLESIRSAIRAQDFDKAIELSQAPEPSGFPEPNLQTAATAWILAGASHHTGLSQALTIEHLRNLAEISGMECLVIDRDTKIADFTNALRWNEVYYHAASGFS